jgi:hypothetical protein
MSIYVYITRRRNPIDEDGPVIDEGAWRSVVSADLTFRDASAEEIGSARPSKSHYSIWLGHPAGLDTWFIWTDGQIDIRNPDEPMVAKAMELAGKLKASVVSEMGEIFNEDGSHKGFVDGEPW